MRILHLLASPWWSGPLEIVAALALAQRDLGHEVSVAVDRQREGGGAEEPAVPKLRALGLLDEGGLALSVKSSPRGVLRDVRRLRLRRGLGVVHAHFSHDHLLARFGLPPGAKLVRSLHAPRSARWSLPRADAYTVPFEALAPKVRRTAPVRVLPAPVPESFARGERVSPAGGRGRIGMASTFQPSRRHLLGLESFALLRRQRPEARLVLLGDGALEGRLRERAARPDLAGSVEFRGYVAGGAFVEALQSLDELWVLGLGNDWSARVAAQGRACGVRIVAVGEGALPSYADALCDAVSPEAVVKASLGGARRQVPILRPLEVARGVLALYAEAGAGA